MDRPCKGAEDGTRGIRAPHSTLEWAEGCHGFGTPTPCRRHSLRRVHSGQGRVDFKRDRPDSGIPPGAGPGPILGSLDQPTLNRVLVDVGDDLERCLVVHDVPVIASAGLPEPQSCRAIVSRRCQPRQPLRGMDAKVIDRPASDGTLDLPEDASDLVQRLTRAKQNMNVLGHDDIGPEVEPHPRPGGLDRLDEPPPSSIARQQGEPPITRKRQFMGMTRLIVAAATFACHGVD
jgi:hypothetical protein